MRELIRFFNGQSRKVFSLEEYQRLVNTVMGGIHVVFLILFMMAHIYIMAVVNVFSVVIYIIAYKLAGPKYGVISYRLSYIEVLLHLIIVTIMLGDGYGFGLYCMAFVPVSYYFFYLFSQQEETREQRFYPLFYSLLAIGIYLALKVYVVCYDPYYKFLTGIGKTVVFTGNFVLVMFALIGFMGVAVVQYISMQEKLEKFALEDSLTGLANRRGLLQVISKAYENHEKYAVILCDIDDFKLVNDTYGHEFGDYILKTIAQKLQSKFSSTDIVSRWGGEEMLIYVKDSSATEAAEITEAVREEIKNLKFENRGIELYVTMTFGIADTTEASNVEDLTHLADIRLYVGKLNGKNQVVYMDDSNYTTMNGDQRLIVGMRGLSENDLFQGLANASENVYLFENDMKSNISKWSDNALQYFGLPEDYATKTLEVWLQHIHPDDRAYYMDDVSQVFQGKKNRHYARYRARNAEGDYVWLECTGNVIRDAKNTPSFFVGIMTRIDDESKLDPVTKER